MRYKWTMIESEFREAVRSGLGRAILYARENDVSVFRDIILDACLHCYSADAQSEGTRAPYMLELVNLTPDRESYCGEVLKALHDSGDDWDAVQRFRFASYMAMDGDNRARRAMYENFHPGPRMVEETGIDFTRMDGLEGFLFAADKVGALLITKPHEVDQGSLLWHTIETFGEEQTLGVLRKTGETNPRVEAYRLAAEEHREKGGANELKEIRALTYAELKPRLSEVRGHRLPWWGQDASIEDLDLAARDLLMAQTSEEQLIHLRIFGRRPFPLDHGSLLQLAASDDEPVSVVAARALANIKHPDVRELAFRLVETRRPGREEAISMLARNWTLGDHEIVLGWFEQEEDRVIRHGLGIDLRNFWKHHPDAATEGRMLLNLYEKGPCSACRGFLLSRLIELESLPDSIREEWAYDANEDVRQLGLATSK